jgi:hypothetical protein
MVPTACCRYKTQREKTERQRERSDSDRLPLLSLTLMLGDYVDRILAEAVQRHRRAHSPPAGHGVPGPV